MTDGMYVAGTSVVGLLRRVIALIEGVVVSWGDAREGGVEYICLRFMLCYMTTATMCMTSSEQLWADDQNKVQEKKKRQKENEHRSAASANVTGGAPTASSRAR